MDGWKDKWMDTTKFWGDLDACKVFMDACVVLHARRDGLRTLVMIAVGLA